MTLRGLALIVAYASALLVLAVALSIRADANELEELATITTSTTSAPAPPPLEVPNAEVSPNEAPVEPSNAGLTPSVLVGPPAWIEIPADLVATPTAVSAEAVPLPMLTSIPSNIPDGTAVYLTFDDGPNPAATNQILDLLAAYNAKATFFVLGNSVDAYPGVAQRIVAEGHAIGNHTYGHEALPRITADQVRETLAATQGAIQRATGRTTTCMRPPYGSLDQATYDVVRSAGYSVSMWDVDSDDWKVSDGYTIAANVLAATDPGDRVLLHDGPTGRSATVSALESVLAVLSNRGVRFEALPC